MKIFVGFKSQQEVELENMGFLMLCKYTTYLKVIIAYIVSSLSGYVVPSLSGYEVKLVWVTKGAKLHL